MNSPSVTTSVHVRSTFRNLFFASISIFLIVSLPSRLHGQTVSGITGTVSDSSGAVLPEAAIRATNEATGVTTHATTTSAGTYAITDLIPGAYTVKIEKSGFRAAVYNGVIVEAGGRKTTVDGTLSAGALNETVEVNAQAVSLETEQPELGATVESKALEELPAEIGGGVGDRGRQIDTFLFLTPGIQGGSFSHRINGGVDFENEVVFNGVTAVQSETKGFQSNINPPYEMVNEFRVLTSVFSAQYGLAQGVATYQFASGTNAFHGDGFEILRNDMFDARGAFPTGSSITNGVLVKGPVPADKLHNYGFSVGGPIWKDRTFFFVSAEWYRHNQTQGGTMTVPTAAEVGGDFSHYVDNNGNIIPVFVPATWSSNPNLIPAGCTPGAAPGQQFPGNKIPTSCFSPLSKTLLPLVPAPTFNLNGFGANITSQIGVLDTRQTSWGFSVDHNLTDKQKLHGSFFRDKYNLPSCCDNGANFANALSGEKQEPRLGTGVFLTYSNALSNHVVMTAGVGWMGEINNELNSHKYSFPAAVGSTVLPRMQFNSPFGGQPTTWGSGLNGGESFSDNRKLGISFVNNWLYTRGKHTFNVGWEIRRAYQDDFECQQCAGNFAFASQTTADPANTTGTGSAFASFLLGDVDSAKRLIAAENRLRNFYFAPYLQDNIKITPKFGVDAGLRWDIMRPFTENVDNVVFFDPLIANPGAISPATGEPLLGAATKLGTCPGCAGFHHANTQWHNFSPRLGFTYEATPKTVILGGFALNFLEGGAFEFGDNKVSVNYGSLLAGLFNVNSNGNNIPAYGSWDTTTMPLPPPIPFSPTLVNGTGVLHEFSKNRARAPYTQAWNFGVQRELPWNMFMSVSYVGNRSLHLPSMLNPPNQLSPGDLARFCPTGVGTDPTCLLSPDIPGGNNSWTGGPQQIALAAAGFAQASVNCPDGTSGTFFTPYVNFLCDYGAGASLTQAVLPYPMYNSSASCGGLCNNFDMSGSAFYNALQVQTQKRFTNGVSFLVAYTLSRTMASTDTGFSSFNFGAVNKFNQRPEWTVAANDQPHVLSISTVYELPIGRGKRFLNGGGLLKQNLLGGWQLSGVFQYSSGNLNANGFLGEVADFKYDVFGNGFNRANLVPGIHLSENWHNYWTGQPIINVNAFSDPGYAMGNAPRVVGALRDRSFSDENIGLAKKLKFGERVNGELRMEFYNVLNRVQQCDPDFNFSDSSFGIINNGTPCQKNNPRRGQAYFKVAF
jgi:hypothetical protein